ncbi:MAG TPA: hypothetical protein PLQ54_03630 [Armatimonadota bacterium]|nr:hypothetical protein [Armatimonadota bacterium]
MLLTMSHAVIVSSVLVPADGTYVCDIGSRLELFVDDWLIERLEGGADRRLHHPEPREVALVLDRSWEGNAVGYVTVFRDGEGFRMYYRGAHVVYTPEASTETHPEYTCLAESPDGVHWERPVLGLHEIEGSRDNNVVVAPAEGWGLATHNFTPFIDPRPGVPAAERYKALGGVGQGAGGVYAFASADGVRWRKLHDGPVITEGDFDSQNLAFWDASRGEYRFYGRKFRDGRDIITCTSPDFVSWTTPQFVDYSPGRVSELYTNQVWPYPRAPHIWIGFPTRYIDRGWTEAARHLPQIEYRELRAKASVREGTALTDGMLMSTRDGQHFDVWPESFIRPGLRTAGNWFYGDNYQCLGLIETPSAIEGAPPELSFFATENNLQKAPARLRRFAIRVDGFVSIQAPLSGGELLTRPLLFAGSRLLLNYSTSAAGSVQEEIQDTKGQPMPGFSLAESEALYGDSLEQAVVWKGSPDLAALSGQAVRLRFVLRDADLYSLRFG